MAGACPAGAGALAMAEASVGALVWAMAEASVGALVWAMAGASVEALVWAMAGASVEALAWAMAEASVEAGRQYPMPVYYGATTPYDGYGFHTVVRQERHTTRPVAHGTGIRKRLEGLRK